MDAASYAPQMGAVPSEFSGSPRMLIVRSYVIFYEPLAEGDGIAIWRVLRGARQMDDLVRRPGRVG